MSAFRQGIGMPVHLRNVPCRDVGSMMGREGHEEGGGVSGEDGA